MTFYVLYVVWWRGGTRAWWGAVIDAPTSFLECVVYRRHTVKHVPNDAIVDLFRRRIRPATGSANEHSTTVSFECACEPE
jgi:hypothetical protein